MAFLKKVQVLELKIDEFLNLVSESGILFSQVVSLYLSNQISLMEEKCERIRTHERTADEYRKNIEEHLYRHTLIPENRGDVLAILENTDDVINQIKSSALDLLTEKPEIPEFINQYVTMLAQSNAHAVEEVIKAVRAFFHNIHSVNDYAHKVFFYEKEVDELGEKIRKEIFASKIELARKLHLKQILLEMELVSDYCQNVCDRLIIYTIKRQL
ncbi:MAG: DUF47 family protein [Candidatus Cloacimonetes bacterium]|jgi:hypothetical protein|nr:DUF47 family protein [Candidatus Cloacimonadota bacterium]HPM00725.1 DUF47 family protein [Candidatus Cloacimonadota bacterium]